MPPRVLVGCPTYEGKAYCLDVFSRAVRSLKYARYDILLVDNSRSGDYAHAIVSTGLPVTKIPWHEDPRERVTRARNVLRGKALEEGYDFFFSLEQDVVPEPDVLARLLSHDRKVVTGVVVGVQQVAGKPALVPLVYTQPQGNNEADALWYVPKEEIDKPQLLRIKASGLGCIVIHRSVLEEIKFRHAQGFDDMMFSKDCMLHGFPLWCDTSVQPRHYSRPMKE